jgi:hypothetical protein
MTTKRDTTFLVEKPTLTGVSFPPMHGTGGLFTKSSGISVILASLKQLLLTSKGERVMLPEYGTNIRKHLFDPDNENFKAEIQTEIIQAISRWEPRVSIRDISVGTDTRVGREGYNGVRVKLHFSVAGQPHTPHTLTLVI